MPLANGRLLLVALLPFCRTILVNVCKPAVTMDNKPPAPDIASRQRPWNRQYGGMQFYYSGTGGLLNRFERCW